MLKSPVYSGVMKFTQLFIFSFHNVMSIVGQKAMKYPFNSKQKKNHFQELLSHFQLLNNKLK